MRKEKQLEKIAKTIFELEKECQLGINIQENLNKIEQITTTLSFEEMLKIDEYLINKNLLTF